MIKNQKKNIHHLHLYIHEDVVLLGLKMKKPDKLIIT